MASQRGQGPGARVGPADGLDARLDGAAQIVGHKTSMLQDLEQGRPLELEALVGAVVELGGIVGVPTPALEGLYGMTKLLTGSREA